MRVLQIGKFYHPSQGGVESLLKQLSEYLAPRTSLRVIVASENLKGSSEEINGVKVLRMPSLGRPMSTSLTPSLPGLIHRLKADILHIHLPNPVAVMSCLAVQPSAKIIVSWHSDIVKQQVARKFYQPFEHIFLQKVSRIIVATPLHIKYSDVLNNYKNKCSVLPFGVNHPEFIKNSAISKESEDIKSRYAGPVYLFVGRFVYYKGIEVLLNAFRHVPGSLLLIGDGPLKKDIQSQIIQYDLQDRVHLLDNVHGQRALLPYLHACDIFVLPSVEKSEAFAIVQVEAAACGKPVISTQLKSGVPWVNQNGKTGITVEPKNPVKLAEAMRVLGSNPQLAELYGSQGMTRARAIFNTSEWCRGNLRIYREVLHKP